MGTHPSSTAGQQAGKRTVRAAWLTPARLWSAILLLWSVLLTGILTPFVGSPGVIQAIRLQDLLDSRQKQVDQLQDQIRDLQLQAEALRDNRVLQQREIRRVLGYAASDELIFDFSSGNDGV